MPAMFSLLLGEVSPPLPNTRAGNAIKVVTAPVAARKLRRDIAPAFWSLIGVLFFINQESCVRSLGAPASRRRGHTQGSRRRERRAPRGCRPAVAPERHPSGQPK